MSEDPRKRLLWAAIDERKEELIELCARTIMIPSPNPPGNTSEIVAFVTRHLESLGLNVQRYEVLDGAPNLVASLGQKESPHLVVNSHLDTFPPAGGAWTHPPYGGVVADGRIYGCGATDMRAGLAVSLFLATLLTQHDVGLDGRLTLSYSSDEETGGRWGTEWLLNNVPGMRGDACVIGDQNGVGAVAVGEKGFCWLRLSIEGHSSHAAYGGSLSATRELSRVLPVLYSLEEVPADVAPGLAAWNDLRNRVTVNVGKIAGGVSPNLVADRVVAEVDIRIPMGLTVDEVLGKLRRRIETENLRCQMEVLLAMDPTITPLSSVIVEIAACNDALVMRTSPERIIRVGASDARLFRRAGIPTIIYGPTPHNMGAPDDYVAIEDLLVVAQVHAGIVTDFLRGQRVDA